MKATILSTLAPLFFLNLAEGAGPDGLVRLYEEEILAHDLYVALGKLHPGVRPLQNIPHSEALHREMMAEVLKGAGIPLPKPAANRRFVSNGLDQTYADWLAEGSKSAADACRVGARLEDHDISELRKAQTDFPQHRDQLARLEAASNNHLRAFHRNLTARGGDYKPEALTAEEIGKILTGRNTGCGGTCATPCAPGKEPETAKPPVEKRAGAAKAADRRKRRKSNT